MNDEDRFNDLTELLNLISTSKKSGDFKSDKYWLGQFPDYTLKHYYFADSDLKPGFETSRAEGGTWHFYSMTEHLVENLDIEFLECKNNKDGRARLEFYALGYPYGGIGGLTMFLNSFDFRATEIDEGGGVYSVNWISETQFELKEIKTSASNGNSSFWRRIRKMFGN